jgi:arylformamidase
MLGTAAAMAATPALAEGCKVGLPQHHKGPLVFMDYDQLELDASYDQVYYEPLIAPYAGARSIAVCCSRDAAAPGSKAT